MLGADVVVAERERLAQGELEDLLGARRERDLARRDLVALADDAGHLGTHLLDRDVEGIEDARGETFLFAQQPEQDVLGADVVVLERAGLVLSEDDDLAGSLCETLKHKALRTLPEALRRTPGTPRAPCRTGIGTIRPVLETPRRGC